LTNLNHEHLQQFVLLDWDPWFLTNTLKTPIQPFDKWLNNFWQFGKKCLQHAKIHTCNQLGIGVEHLQQFGKLAWHSSNLAKQEKLAINSLTNQLGKNGNLAKLISPCGNIRAPTELSWKKMKDRQELPMQVFKRWNDINIILFLF
jgi:hypothetical protein